MVAARQRTPRKGAAVFSWRVATALHSFKRARPRQRLGPLDAVAVVVDRLRAGDGGFVDLRRDGGPCAEAPDVVAEGVAAIAAIGHDPHRHAGQAPQQRYGLRRLVRLAGRYAEGDRAARGVGDHAESEACL